MKKKILAIGFVSMFLLTSITTLSATGEKTELLEKSIITKSNSDICRVYGYVRTLMGKEIANATVTIGECFPSPGDYQNRTTTSSDGFYEFTDVPNIWPDDPDILRVYKLSSWKDGYKSTKIKEIAILPYTTKVRVDFILIKSKAASFNTFFMRFLEHDPYIFPILRYIIERQ